VAILIASDSQTKAARIRNHLLQDGYDCPLTSVVPVDAVRQNAAAIHPKPDLVVLILSQEHDRALATLRHLRESIETPILAVGPRDPNLILDTLHAGASDYLDEASDFNRDLSAAMTRILESVSKRSTTGRLMTVVGSCGGSGRTFFATNLAVQLAKMQQRCALFDLDLIGGDVATCLNLKPRHSIADLCHNIDKLDQKMFEQCLVEHPSGVSVLAAPEDWTDARSVSADGLQKVIRFGKNLFPSVVAEINSFWISEFAVLLQQSEAILKVLRLDFPGIRNAHRALMAFDRAGIDQSKVQIVAARFGRPKEIGVTQAEEVLGMKIRYFLPEDPATVNACVNWGTAVVTESPSSAIARAIADVAATICEENGPQNSSPAGHINGKKLPVLEKVRSLFGWNAAGRRVS
jgi:pilus assembly protein CpaE